MKRNMVKKMMNIGLDVGSTTIKCVVLDENEKICFQSYERHFSQITEKMTALLTKLKNEVVKNNPVQLAISGSAGMGIAEECKYPFVQEVYATRIATAKRIPEADVIIELGGEDAKILFVTNGMEVRMNGSCAGGTGAFIDQMSTLLNVTPEDLNHLAQEHQKIYTIASRCGVFAKSDVQPLLNQGARKSDIAASIFNAVANQTIAGLAQGREIKGNIVYLGGPLTFLSELRKSFNTALNVTGIFPENSLYFVALGTAYSCKDNIDLDHAIGNIKNYTQSGNFLSIPPLFNSTEEFEAFEQRHKKAVAKRGSITTYIGDAYLGIDAGSTTIKAVLIGSENQILDELYQSNSGDPIPIINQYLINLYEQYPNLNIKCSAVTGYGEDLLKHAFGLDYGIVETIAHYTAAKTFLPDVDFIIDIGGQDMKCFKVRNNTIDNIFLNEACSSGCGSFLQTFANTLGYDIIDFARKGLFAKRPVDLGSRCTVFMNSSVKQAQKDGATTEDISAGLSVSVVKNAIYKVIRAASPDELGKHIVVQGGTFLNDAVLRVFEEEMGVHVIRPDIAGLMGAYGAAVYAKEHNRSKGNMLNIQKLKAFSHHVKMVTCSLCNNHCKLTVNQFNDSRKFIGGNRCDKPIKQHTSIDIPNMYETKLKTLLNYTPIPGPRGKIGLPMGMNMYEMLPFWHAFFTSLGFEVVTSPLSNRDVYIKGQHTIPSDTVCYPAKLMHGHVYSLLNEGVTTIFYPCLTYNFDEGLSDNHYNCPVVAYYPEVISANVPELEGHIFINDYLGVHRKKDFPQKIHGVLNKYFDGISLKEIKTAAEKAYAEYERYFETIRKQGDAIIEQAEANQKPIIVLCGRPYHLDPEINHGIDKIITSLGAYIVTEDVISSRVAKLNTTVLNQWTYHARLYAAAEYICNKPQYNLVQLVSFGCGIDSITTDEVRSILENNGKIYTQIKIDEITNQGAVKIRLRSLFATLEQ